jgi:hypothetical protein
MIQDSLFDIQYFSAANGRGYRIPCAGLGASPRYFSTVNRRSSGIR